MSFLFFDADRKGFDDGEGNSVSLGDHLYYLETTGGTPDCYDSLDILNRLKAVDYAKKSGIYTYVVRESDYKVVAIVNKPEKDQ